MKALVLTTKAEADALSADVDAAMGLPTYGVDVGGGRHVDREQSRTLRYAEPLPTKLGEWAYPYDQEKEAQVLTAAKGTGVVEADVSAVIVPVADMVKAP